MRLNSRLHRAFGNTAAASLRIQLPHFSTPSHIGTPVHPKALHILAHHSFESVSVSEIQ